MELLVIGSTNFAISIIGLTNNRVAGWMQQLFRLLFIVFFSNLDIH